MHLEKVMISIFLSILLFGGTLIAEVPTTSSEQLELNEKVYDDIFFKTLESLEEFVPNLVGISLVWESFDSPELFEEIFTNIGEYYDSDVANFSSAFSSLQSNTPNEHKELLHRVLESSTRTLTAQVLVVQRLRSSIQDRINTLTLIETEWKPEWGSAPSYAETYKSCTATVIGNEKTETSNTFLTLTNQMNFKADFFAKTSTTNIDFTTEIFSGIGTVYEELQESLTDTVGRFLQGTEKCLDAVDFDSYISLLEKQREVEE